jgi:hypothetical protein
MDALFDPINHTLCAKIFSLATARRFEEVYPRLALVYLFGICAALVLKGLHEHPAVDFFVFAMCATLLPTFGLMRLYAVRPTLRRPVVLYFIVASVIYI